MVRINLSKLTIVLMVFVFSTRSLAEIFSCTALSGSITSPREVIDVPGGGGPTIVNTDRGIRDLTTEEYFGSCSFYPVNLPDMPIALWSCASSAEESILGSHQIIIWNSNLHFAATVTNPNATIAKVGNCIKI